MKFKIIFLKLKVREENEKKYWKKNLTALVYDCPNNELIINLGGRT